MSRLEAGSALPVRAWFADIRSHVWPVVREGELLGGQRLQDLAHEPSAGAHTRPGPGSQRTAAPDQPVTVSRGRHWVRLSIWLDTCVHPVPLSVYTALQPTPTWSCGSCRGNKRRGRDWYRTCEERRRSATSAANTATQSLEHHGKSQKMERISKLLWRRSTTLRRYEQEVVSFSCANRK